MKTRGQQTEISGQMSQSSVFCRQMTDTVFSAQPLVFQPVTQYSNAYALYNQSVQLPAWGLWHAFASYAIPYEWAATEETNDIIEQASPVITVGQIIQPILLPPPSITQLNRYLTLINHHLDLALIQQVFNKQQQFRLSKVGLQMNFNIHPSVLSPLLQQTTRHPKKQPIEPSWHNTLFKTHSDFRVSKVITWQDLSNIRALSLTGKGEVEQAWSNTIFSTDNNFNISRYMTWKDQLQISNRKELFKLNKTDLQAQQYNHHPALKDLGKQIYHKTKITNYTIKQRKKQSKHNNLSTAENHFQVSSPITQRHVAVGRYCTPVMQKQTLTQPITHTEKQSDKQSLHKILHTITSRFHVSNAITQQSLRQIADRQKPMPSNKETIKRLQQIPINDRPASGLRKSIKPVQSLITALSQQTATQRQDQQQQRQTLQAIEQQLLKSDQYHHRELQRLQQGLQELKNMLTQKHSLNIPRIKPPSFYGRL